MLYLLNHAKAENSMDYGVYFTAGIYNINTQECVDISSLSSSMLYKVIEGNVKNDISVRLDLISTIYCSNLRLNALIGSCRTATSWVESELLIPFILLKKVKHD